MRESRTLEFKLKVTNTFLKTVSAYANYGSGTIMFGVDDAGTRIGVEDPEQTCLDIENKLNDSIEPNPDYTLAVKEDGVIELTVSEGAHKPYLYRAKAYKRNDTSTIEVDRVELARLVLEGENLSFEETRSRRQELSFTVLERWLQEALSIERLTDDMLRTLELEDRNGIFNVAAELLADENGFPGVDMVRFGENINVFLDRQTSPGVSVLQQYDEAVAFFERYYTSELVEGSRRIKTETVPELAYREAVANALVHRQWDTPSTIRISMHPDRIEVVSPGGLPAGLSEAEYLNGQISTLRNPIIGSVFYRLGLIERFGTGILRIKESYGGSASKPTFKLYENSTTVVLPVLDSIGDLTYDEQALVNTLKDRKLSMSEIVERCGFGRTKTKRLLRGLAERGRVTVAGTGRGTRYTA